MERPAPHTLEEFNTPVHREAWRLNADGRSYTWAEYEQGLYAETCVFAMIDAMYPTPKEVLREGRP